MNEEQAEIAIAMLHEQRDVMSPHYQELIGRFGEVSIAGNMLHDLKALSAEQHATYKLIQHFTRGLPIYSNRKNKPEIRENEFPVGFYVSSIAEAQKILSTVVWMGNPTSDIQGDRYSAHYKPLPLRPHFIVGRLADSKTKEFPHTDTQLVLSSAYDNKLTVLSLNHILADAVENKLDANLGNGLNPEEAESLLSIKAGTMVVRPVQGIDRFVRLYSDSRSRLAYWNAFRDAVVSYVDPADKRQLKHVNKYLKWLESNLGSRKEYLSNFEDFDPTVLDIGLTMNTDMLLAIAADGSLPLYPANKTQELPVHEMPAGFLDRWGGLKRLSELAIVFDKVADLEEWIEDSVTDSEK